MAATEIISYMVVLIISILFSLSSLGQLINAKNKQVTIDWLAPIFEGFAFIGWIVMVPLHLGFVGEASLFLLPPAILYFALAILFLLFALFSVFSNLQGSILSKRNSEGDVSTV